MQTEKKAMTPVWSCERLDLYYVHESSNLEQATDLWSAYITELLGCGGSVVRACD